MVASATDQAVAGYDQSVAAYRGTVLTAFKEVEDNLAALRILEEEAAIQAEAVKAAELSLEISLNQYRAGIITAITVLLGFSLTFLRFWSFEAPGKWTPRSVVSTGILVVAVGLQIYALFRSLRLEDDEASEYRKTVAWFIASAPPKRTAAPPTTTILELKSNIVLFTAMLKLCANRSRS